MFKRMFWAAFVLALFGFASPTMAQQRQVTGTVTGDNNEPLVGAEVRVAGSSRGVRTGSGGTFTLPVGSGDARIRVTALGYRAREVAVPAGQASVAVRLEADVLGLETVVVTGQATEVRRQNLANDVAVVTARDLTDRVSAQTLDRALQGKVAGATIRTNSGAPGGGAQIRIRGPSTLTGNATPLYVVDGVIVSDVAIPGGQNAISRANSAAGVNNSVQDNTVNRIADLNPADVESIEVLKGASAASIYGSRAASGVVVITTKRGRAGAPRFTLSQRFGVASISNKLGARTWTLDEAVDAYGDDVAEYFDPATGEALQTYDLEEQVFGREAPQAETNLSVSGGNESTQYYVSAVFANNQGIAHNTGFLRQGGTVNLRQALTSRVRLNVNSSVQHSVASRGITGNDNSSASYVSAIAFSPSFFSYEPQNGVFPRTPFTDSNPLETSMLSTNNEDVWRIIGSVNLTADLFESATQTLRFVGTGGADYFDQQNRLYFPPTLQLQPFGDQPGTTVAGGGNNLNLNGNVNLVHVLEPASGVMTATTSAGIQYEERDLRLQQVTGRFLLGDLDLPYQAANQVAFGNRQRSKVLGGYVQEELLLLDERLSLTASVRGDRSSNNADTDQLYFYPKLAGAYWFPWTNSYLDSFKLRAAFGASGQEPLYGQKYTALTTGNIGGIPQVTVTGNIGAADLRPERVTEFEGGFDATVLGERAQLSVTAYRRNITDLLLSRGLATSSGFVTEFFNGGELQSTGLEIGLQGTPIVRGDFAWTSNTTFSRNRSEVTSLPVPEFSPGNSFGNTYGGYRIAQGHSPTEVYAVNGLDENGVVKVESIGESEPDFQMGFLNELRLGRFAMSSLFDWSHGGLVINLSRNYYDAAGTAPDYLMPSGVTEPRDPYCGCLSGQERLEYEGTYPVYVEDGSFVKLREVALTYDLPGAWLGNRVSSAQISVSGRNLKTWTDYTGYDPEVSNFGNVPTGRNQDVTPFPPSRTFWVGVNLVF